MQNLNLEKKLLHVYVLILNWNHKEDLIETLESFVHQDYNNLRVVIIDNGSNDGSQTLIKKKYPKYTLLENEKNLGWAGGNNVGIKYALSKKADFILLANNDLYFEDKTIVSKLVNSLLKYPQIGVIGPQEYHYYQRAVSANKGWILFSKSKFRFNIYRKKMNDLAENFEIVDNVSGSFMLIKSELFDKIGLIDEPLFLYGEDADFSLRAWEVGFASVIDTSLTIYHKISATSGNNSPLKCYYKTRNLFYLVKKHKRKQESHIYFLFRSIWDFFKISIKIWLQKKYYENRSAKFKAHLLGGFHGLFSNRMGKYY